MSELKATRDLLSISLSKVHDLELRPEDHLDTGAAVAAASGLVVTSVPDDDEELQTLAEETTAHQT